MELRCDGLRIRTCLASRIDYSLWFFYYCTALYHPGHCPCWQGLKWRKQTVIIALALLFLTLLGAPLFSIIGGSALWGFHSEGIDLQVVTIEIYRLAEMPILLAIPLFTFAGYLLGESQAPARMVRMAHALLGWMPGGLAIVALTACALFTAFTGASGVTIIALGTVLFPALVASGYSERFSLGLI